MAWAICATCALCLAEPETVYIESEPEIVTVIEKVEVPIEPENTAYYKDIVLTEEEKIMVGKVIYSESGNQSFTGRRCVAEVIFNRLLSDQWPDTIAEVLYAPYQFTNPGGFDWTQATEEQGRAQFDVIDAVLKETVPILRTDCVYFATYDANGTFYEKIGAHYFAY